MKLLPSVEKCFLDEDIDSKYELKRVSMLRNERLSFQVAYTCDSDGKVLALRSDLRFEGALADKISVSRIELIPVLVPSYPWTVDDDYLRREPGLYPDLLLPFDLEKEKVAVAFRQLRSHYVTIEDTDGIEPGEYELTVILTCGELEERAVLKVTVLDAFLPEMNMPYAHWFHGDCIAAYYQCEVFSERYWELIGNYMDAAARCGVNTMHTPVLTPPTETTFGTERLTVQLVDVFVNNGEYSFGYGKLDRYIAMAKQRGMRYFEISHFFSQWGSNWSPKVMATVDGEYKKIFGIEPNALGDEYRRFIRAFISGLLEHLKELGIDKNCFFHVLDEPKADDLEGYRAAMDMISDLLEGYTIMDAIFTYDVYKAAGVQTPVVESHNIQPFIDNNVPNLWTYNCQGQHTDVANRFVAMPGRRTRIMAAHLFKFKIAGFLQWGFNYWHYVGGGVNNPFYDPCCGYFGQAGDHFSVYPGPDGKALYTLHSEQFYDALQDLRAMQLLETKIGHDAVVKLIEEDCDEPMTFKRYPRTIDYVLGMRERINEAIASK